MIDYGYAASTWLAELLEDEQLLSLVEDVWLEQASGDAKYPFIVRSMTSDFFAVSQVYNHQQPLNAQGTVRIRVIGTQSFEQLAPAMERVRELMSTYDQPISVGGRIESVQFLGTRRPQYAEGPDEVYYYELGADFRVTVSAG